jgi:hypothetical protein
VQPTNFKQGSGILEKQLWVTFWKWWDCGWRYIVYMHGVSACDIYLVFIMKLILVYTKFDYFFFKKGTPKISTWTSLVNLVWKHIWNRWCNSDSWLTICTTCRVDISLTIVGHVWVDTVHVAFCCIVTVFSSNIHAWF